MKRRHFLTASGATAIAASTVYSPNVIAQNQKIRLEMPTSWPAALDNLYGTAEYFARRIGEMTDGDVEVRTYPGGDQIGALEVYDAVSSGAFPCCHTAPYYYIGQSPAHGFYTSIPFGLTLTEQNAWMLAGNGQELWDELNARDSLIAFPGGNTSAQTGGWFNERVRSPEDLKGLRMRFPGHGGRVMAKAGVNIQQLPGGEVFTSMERGTLDAAEWVGPYDDMTLGMQKVAKFYYMPGWAEPSAMLGFYFNMDVWNDFPADIRHQIKACCYEANSWMAAQYLNTNPGALQTLQEEHGIEVLDFPDSVMDAFHEGARKVHEEDMEDEMYARIYEDWNAFRSKVRGWNERSTYQYREYLFNR